MRIHFIHLTPPVLDERKDSGNRLISLSPLLHLLGQLLNAIKGTMSESSRRDARRCHGKRTRRCGLKTLTDRSVST
ncbi:unnamed protein product [Coffea canephora]|uniref:DH200=94 genomic scaffold, scaffold_473 n=1 Tax=Coffea canephora TaxID=49390 RepID=A0A068VFS8_COFCA|nr:unnamed protein product [Coffea canephora]